MAYSLFLGTGPVVQVEIFSALCKTAVDKGTSLDEAVEESYERVKEISLNLQQTQDKNPFPGYGNGREDFDQVFERFQPRFLYGEYAKLVLPQIDFPLIAVEGEESAYQDFCRIVDETDLGDKVFPIRMKFVSVHYMETRANYDIDLQLPDVRTIIDERGFPSLIAGGHFLSICQHSDTREYGAIKINGNIPLDAVTSLMGDNTQLLFLEEGDLVYDEGRRYAKAFNDEKPTSYKVEPKRK